MINSLSKPYFVVVVGQSQNLPHGEVLLGQKGKIALQLMSL